MEPDAEDRLMLKVVALAAAAVVNAGTGAPAGGVLAQAAEYERSLVEGLTPQA